MVEVKSAKIFSEKWRENIILTKEEQMKQLEDEFEKIINKLIARKNFLKKNYEESCKEELNNADNELKSLDAAITLIEQNGEKLNEYCKTLGNKVN